MHFLFPFMLTPPWGALGQEQQWRIPQFTAQQMATGNIKLQVKQALAIDGMQLITEVPQLEQLCTDAITALNQCEATTMAGTYTNGTHSELVVRRKRNATRGETEAAPAPCEHGLVPLEFRETLHNKSGVGAVGCFASLVFLAVWLYVVSLGVNCSCLNAGL